MEPSTSQYNLRSTNEISKMSQGNVPWTQEEKRRLIKGLKKYGDQDLNALHSIVQSKFKFQIDQFIRQIKKKARKKYARETPQVIKPLETWYNIMRNKTTSTTINEPRPQAILALLYARRTDLPEYNSDTCPVHLDQAYEYIFSLFSGRRHQVNGPSHISTDTKLFVHATIAELRKKILKNKSVLYKALKKSLNAHHYEPNPDNYRSVSIHSSSLNPLQLLTEPIKLSALRQ